MLMFALNVCVRRRLANTLHNQETRLGSGRMGTTSGFTVHHFPYQVRVETKVYCKDKTFCSPFLLKKVFSSSSMCLRGLKAIKKKKKLREYVFKNNIFKGTVSLF